MNGARHAESRVASRLRRLLFRRTRRGPRSERPALRGGQHRHHLAGDAGRRQRARVRGREGEGRAQRHRLQRRHHRASRLFRGAGLRACRDRVASRRQQVPGHHPPERHRHHQGQIDHRRQGRPPRDPQDEYDNETGTSKPTAPLKVRVDLKASTVEIE
ncbi:MAG: hypothetical protein WDN31_01105 [Hyphomicrobium sp.]